MLKNVCTGIDKVFKMFDKYNIHIEVIKKGIEYRGSDKILLKIDR